MSSISKISTLLSFIFLFSFGLLSSQIYVKNKQNKSWNSDSEISTVILKPDGETATVTPSLKMIQFKEFGNDSNTFGWDTSNPIPNGWDYEILTGTGNVPSNVSVADNKKSISVSVDPDAEITIYLKITDEDGDIVDKLERVPLTFYLRSNLVVATAQWNACEQSFDITLNEQTLNGEKICAPYRIIVYNNVYNSSTETYTVDTSTVVYDSQNQQSNLFQLRDLDAGSYAAIITNSCGERVSTGESNYYTFSIGESYAFGASLVFAGFECIDDPNGTAVVKVEGAAVPITWTLKNNNTNSIILTEEDENDFSTVNYNANFDTQNYTVVIPNLDAASYTFEFVDGLGCDSSLDFELKRPVEIENELDTNASKLNWLLWWFRWKINFYC